MSRSYEEVQEEALELSVEERSRLAEDLLDSLLTEEERAIEQEWLEVAERRRAEADAGTSTLIPAEDVIRELKAKYSARHQRSR
jgi:putative addiction module component (TIGR02574 family)